MSQLFITLQAKGGVGKSYVSSILAQYFQDANLPIHCIDTDTTNPTLQRYKPLNCQYVKLSEAHVINPRAFDELVEIVSTAPEDRRFVVDVGSNGFQPFMAYAVENDLFAVLESLDVRVVINSVIAGGPDAHETLRCTKAVLEQTRVPTLMWLNAHLGALEFKNRPIQHLELFDAFAYRILGWVTLPKYPATTFGQDIESMLKQRWTFNETIDQFTLMPRVRIQKAKRDLWGQLDQVFFPRPEMPDTSDTLLMA
ncbi:conjugal transfer protein TraL [Thiocystis violacea]|uniref:conjugal transfer protein TraL n=1 Tax=Thiocystis violacea TaxID=13725 RepID=UPI0019078132|nr:conjugal transfer protein TraL [Thiocystis violacea]MBK1720106.1 conjugal transfer protein TraL [Thiocystis violacea]